MRKHDTRRRWREAEQQDCERIALEAAKLMVTENIGSPAAARAKALRRLGLERVRRLPTAARIEAALKDYRSIFGGSEQLRRIDQLRRLALDAMKFFEHYQPQLVGPVASGATTRGSRVTLHVFSDTPEEIGMRLHDHGIPYRLQDKSYRFASGDRRRCPAYCFIAGDVEVQVAVLPVKSRHNTPIDPTDKLPYARTSRRELEHLIKETSALAFPSAG